MQEVGKHDRDAVLMEVWYDGGACCSIFVRLP